MHLRGLGGLKTPWITNELRQRIRDRDFLKKKPNLSNDPSELYKNTWNDNLAAIFEAKLKAAIDNRGVKKMTIFKRCF